MKFQIEYHSNGFLKSLGEIADGKKEGRWIFLYDNGIPQRVIDYSNDLENGIWYSWHENGNPHVESERKYGKRVGVVKEYYENGCLKEVGEYEGDQYIPLDFWDPSNNHTLINGTGKKVETYGATDNEAYEFYYENRKFIKEVKISSVTYLRFKPNKSE